jgi:hypothetical protein
MYVHNGFDYEIITKISEYNIGWPNTVAARSKAWVCGHSLAGTVGSNTSGGMDVCLF